MIDQELRAIEADIDGLYRNLFIETCDEWVVPYIGDLLRVGGVHVARPQGFSQRACVANTLAYRRRKGTAAVLEQLARDVTGWPARVVEFFARLATTQHLNHVRLSNVRTPDLRETNHLELLGGPFSAPRTPWTFGGSSLATAATTFPTLGYSSGACRVTPSPAGRRAP